MSPRAHEVPWSPAVLFVVEEEGERAAVPSLPDDGTPSTAPRGVVTLTHHFIAAS